MTMDEYRLLKHAFLGGFTHANARYVDETLKDVASYDIASSYPTVMVSEQYPMGPGVFVPCKKMTLRKLKSMMLDYCSICHVRLTEVMDAAGFEHILSGHKLMNKLEPNQFQLDNGRIVWADEVEITVTDVDLLWLTTFYNYEKLEFMELVVYPKAPLPLQFVKTVLDLYSRKTSLKDLPGREVDYMVSKNMINAMYGMSVMAAIRKIIEYDSDQHVYKNVDEEEEVAMEKYNNNPQRFLFYPWGVWVTAYARSNLYKAIYSLRDDYIYADTDSVKFLHPIKHQRWFQRYNKEITEKMYKVLGKVGLTKSEIKNYVEPMDVYGKRRPLGIYEFEEVYPLFKTLGAKRYLIKNNKGLKLTCAGVNKNYGAEYLSKFDDPFEKFEDGLIFPASYSKRLTLTYIDDVMEGEITDYMGQKYHYHQLSGIHMEPTDYKMSKANVVYNYIENATEFYVSEMEGL